MFTGAYIGPGRCVKAAEAISAAERLKQLSAAQTQKEIEGIRNGDLVYDHATGQLVKSDVSAEPQSIVAHALRSVIAEEVSKQLKFEEILLRAEQISMSRDDSNTNDKPIDPDWFQSYKSYAEKAHKDDLKEMWAKILVEEAETPGQFSLRTFNFIQHLTNAEATLVQNLLKIRASNIVLLTSNTGNLGLDGFLTYEEVLELENMGVISGSTGNVQHEVTIPAQDLCIYINHTKVLIIRNITDADINFKSTVLNLTAIGQNLAAINDDLKADDAYLRKVGAQIAKKAGLSVSLADVMQLSSNSYRYKNEVTIDPA